MARDLTIAVKDFFKGSTDVVELEVGVMFKIDNNTYLLSPMYKNQAFLYSMRPLSYVIGGTKYNTEIPSELANIYEIRQDLEGNCKLVKPNITYVFNEENIKYGVES